MRWESLIATGTRAQRRNSAHQYRTVIVGHQSADYV